MRALALVGLALCTQAIIATTTTAGTADDASGDGASGDDTTVATTVAATTAGTADDASGDDTTVATTVAATTAGTADDASGDGASCTCVDTDNGATDEDGLPCDWYTVELNPADSCGRHDTDLFISSEMCCACGGGDRQGCTTAPTVAPTVAATTVGTADDASGDDLSPLVMVLIAVGGVIILAVAGRKANLHFGPGSSPIAL